MTMPKSSALINCCCGRGERAAGLQRDLRENIKYDSFNLPLNPNKAASYGFTCRIDTKATYHCRRPDRRILLWCIGSVLRERTFPTSRRRKKHTDFWSYVLIKGELLIHQQRSGNCCCRKEHRTHTVVEHQNLEDLRLKIWSTDMNATGDSNNTLVDAFDSPSKVLWDIILCWGHRHTHTHTCIYGFQRHIWTNMYLNFWQIVANQPTS